MKIPLVFRNIVTLSMLAWIESLHLLVAAVLVVDYLYPLKYDPNVWNRYFPYLQSAIRPNHDFFLYHCWLVFCVGLQLAFLWSFRKALREENLFPRIKAYLFNEMAFLFLLLFGAFKIIVWQGPRWAWALFYITLIASWLVRIFWPEACKFGAKANTYLKFHHPGPWADVLIMAAVVLFIFPTDMDSILARDFIYEQAHHLDGVIMGPGWAFLSGCRLNVQVLCQYGLGMTVAIAKLAQSLGGFSYPHAVWVYVAASIVYFIAAYVLLRFWLGSILLAAAGVFLSIKFQMFHPGVAPIIWGFPSVTIVRYFFDVFFLFFILHHIRSRQAWGLWAACICSGISLAYMPDTGLYQWLAFCVYLGFCWIEEKRFHYIFYAVFPWIISMLILWMIEGDALFSKVFWQGAMQQGSLFLNGFGDLPVYTNLNQGMFFAFWMGLLIPAVYVFSMIFTASRYALDKKQRENIFIVVLCVYGLGLYHYYVCRSAPTSYHAVDIPFVFLLMYGARRLGRGVRLLILVFCLGGLLTNSLFAYYPNVFNLAGYDWAKEKAFWQQYTNVDDDAGLVRRLTGPSESVAVIANQEVKILMQANRKPLFYFFPIETPSAKYPQFFANTCLFTKTHLKRTLDDLQQFDPKYVFVDANFYKGQLPADVYQDNEVLSVLYKFLHDHYQDSGQQGRNLLALIQR